MAKKIKGVKHPLGAEIEYRRYLLRYLDKAIQYIQDENFRGLENATRGAIKQAEKTGAKVSAHVVREMKNNLRNGLGKKIATELIRKAISAQDSAILSNFIYYNTVLIQNITNEVQLKVFEEVRKDPEGLEPLAKRIKDATGFSDYRARLIARDQTSKLNAKVSELRHKAAGFTKYVWTTAGDERVRDEHVFLDGNEYEYGAVTDEEEGLPPGEPIQCRCIAEPIFEELENA